MIIAGQKKRFKLYHEKLKGNRHYYRIQDAAFDRIVITIQHPTKKTRRRLIKFTKFLNSLED